jgi:hypothetical protein
MVGNVEINVSLEDVGPFLCVTDEVTRWWTTRAIFDRAVHDLADEFYRDQDGEDPVQRRAYEDLCSLTSAIESNGGLPEVEASAEGYTATLYLNDRGADPERLRVKIQTTRGPNFGRWEHVHGKIKDCDAVLGGTQDRADDIYEAIDEAIRDELAAKARS